MNISPAERTYTVCGVNPVIGKSVTRSGLTGREASLQARVLREYGYTRVGVSRDPGPREEFASLVLLACALGIVVFCAMGLVLSLLRTV